MLLSFLLVLFLPLTLAFPERPFSAAAKHRYNLLPRHLIGELDQLRRDWGIKGASVVVVQRQGDGSWKEDVIGLGVADGRGKRVTGDTLFSIASNSKLFTALSAGLIVFNETITRGPDARLTQRTKIKDVVPEWQLMDPFASNGTDLIDLLSHRTGLPRHDGVYAVEEDKNALISRLRHLRPSTEFRQAWQYNNLAYIVASTLSEHLYGTPFETYVEDNILAPLGMNATTYDGALAKASGRRSDSFVRRGMDVQACIEDLGKKKIGKKCRGELVNVGFVHEGRMNAGPGGVITSGNDMAKWLKLLLNNGQNANNETIIPSVLLAAAATPYTVPYQPPSFSPAEDLISPKTYGLAQEMYTYRGHYTVEHGGAVPGQMSQVMRVPGMGLGVAVMMNDNEFGTGFWQVAQRRIVDTLAGLEKIDWASRVKEEMINGLAKSLPPTRPEDPALPDVPLDSIPGTYTDPAYGELVICSVSANAAQSPACAETLQSNPFIGQVNTTGPTYLAAFPKFWSSHLLFTHHNGSVFTVRSSAHYPETGENVVAQFEWFQAVFAEGGVGFVGNAWGAGPGVEERDWRGGALEDVAEVWFVKQDESKDGTEDEKKTDICL